MNIKNALKNKCINGQISEAEALAIGEQADQIMNDTVEMLNQCKKQLGMFLGGEISELIARIKGQKFNEKEYHHERLPDGQEQ